MTITIGGKAVPVAFTMGAWRVMEEENGLALSDISKLTNDISSREKSRIAVRFLAPLIQYGTPGLAYEDGIAVLADIRPEEYGIAILTAVDCVRKAMETMLAPDARERDFDPVLAELDAKAGDARHKACWRKTAAWGLIAGISITEQEHLAPGVIIDLFVTRQEYDDIQHGIKRKQDDDDDLLLFGEEDNNERGD